MKRLLFLLMLMLFTLSAEHAQSQTSYAENSGGTGKTMKTGMKPLKKMSGVSVSGIAKNNFRTDFPDADRVEWKRDNVFDRVTFTDKDHKDKTAYYDYDGTLVGTTQFTSFSDIPMKAQKEIKARYGDYNIEYVLLYIANQANQTDMLLYDIQFKSTDNYFLGLTKGDQKIVLQVKNEGTVYKFK
jgi:hypothetical protein